MLQRLLSLAAIVLFALVQVPRGTHAQTGLRQHALAKLGNPRFGPDFKSFDWVNADAPKGGTLHLSATGSYDNLNAFTIKGVSAPGLTLLDATLFAPSLDEPATSYAYVAEWAEVAPDFSGVTFGLRAGSRFNDGTPITPEDVIFSFTEQMRASPSIAIYYRNVARAEKSGPRQVTFTFEKAGNRDLPYSVSLLSVLPRHYWQAEGRDLASTTLTPPLSAGPYRIKTLDPGRSITYERVPDWWGKDLPVNAGQYNFDTIHYTLFRDDVPEFEALKSGEIDVTEEFSSKRWATGYDIPVVRDGHLRRIVLSKGVVAPLQGFVLNTRRKRFADPRVRRAFALAYDFESANKSLFYGLYRRINSLFENSELAHRGVPQGRELALLEQHRATLPPEVFTTPYRSPVNEGADQIRANLREASRLLDAAGWKLQGGIRKHEATGETLVVEYLNYDTGFDRIVLPYKQSLARIGIRLDMRIVDPSQYEARLKIFDFDMITDVYQLGHAPGNELREMWGSDAAGKEASRNRIGIKSPAVDALIEAAIYARDRTELVAAARAIDRVILWEHYIVPQWYNPTSWIAHWDHLGRPAKHPSQDPGIVTTWWQAGQPSARPRPNRGDTK